MSSPREIIQGQCDIFPTVLPPDDTLDTGDRWVREKNDFDWAASFVTSLSLSLCLTRAPGDDHPRLRPVGKSRHQTRPEGQVMLDMPERRQLYMRKISRTTPSHQMKPIPPPMQQIPRSLHAHPCSGTIPVSHQTRQKLLQMGFHLIVAYP